MIIIELLFYAVFALIFVATAVFLLRETWRLVAGPSVRRTPRTEDWVGPNGDVEGYVHSGPYGYSPRTPYPQTQYGSGFDPDALWAERTGYDRDHHTDSSERA